MKILISIILVVSLVSSCTVDPAYVPGCFSFDPTNSFFAKCPCTACNASFIWVSNWTCCANCDPNNTQQIVFNSTCTQCVTCPEVLPNCYRCSSNLNCLSCVNTSFIVKNGSCVTCSAVYVGCLLCDGIYPCTLCQQNVYIRQNGVCLLCSAFLPYCLECSDKQTCTKCSSGSHFLLNISSSCVPCVNAMKDCMRCSSINQCFGCMLGYPVINGCSKVIGCIRVDPLLQLSQNCLQCDNLQFTLNATTHTCYCKKGHLTGAHCLDVFGCTNSMIYNTIPQCVSCNYGLNLVYSNFTCVCREQFYVHQQKCHQICGDGYLIQLSCDDGNNEDGDGCSHDCSIQNNYTCLLTNNNPASHCVYKGKITLQLSQVNKIFAQNSADIYFNFIPYVKSLTKMNLSNYVTFNAANCEVLSYQVIDSQLKVTISFNETVQGDESIISMSFDSKYIRSPSTTLNLNLISTTELRLIYNPNLGVQSQLLTQIVYYLGISTYFLLIVGTFAYKLIGIETFHTMHIVLLLQVSNQLYQIYFLNFKNLNLTFGVFGSTSHDFTHYSSRQFNLLGLGGDCFRSLGFIEAILISVLAGFVILKIIHFCINNGQNKQRESTSKKTKNTIFCQKIIQKIHSYYYDYLLFPVTVGFNATILLVFLKNSLSDSSSIILIYGLYFVMICASIFIYVKQMLSFQYSRRYYQLKKELYQQSNQPKVTEVTNDPGFQLHNKQYCFIYLGYNLLLFILLEIQLYYKSIINQYVSLVVIAIFMVYIIYVRPYRNHIHNMSLLFNSLVIIFNIVWILAISKGTMTKQTVIYLNYCLTSSLVLIQALALIRIISAFYKRYKFTKRSLFKEQQAKLKEDKLKSKTAIMDKLLHDQMRYFNSLLSKEINNAKPSIDYEDSKLKQNGKLQSKKQAYRKYFKQTHQIDN